MFHCGSSGSFLTDVHFGVGRVYMLMKVIARPCFPSIMF